MVAGLARIRNDRRPSTGQEWASAIVGHKQAMAGKGKGRCDPGVASYAEMGCWVPDYDPRTLTSWPPSVNWSPTT